MGAGAEGKRLHAYLITWAYSATDERQMHSGSAGRQGYYLFLFSNKRFEVFLKRVHIRSQRHYPIGVEGFFDVFLLQSFFGHMSQT